MRVLDDKLANEEMESLDYSKDKSDSDKSDKDWSVKQLSLKRILTPKSSVYLLRDIAQAQSDSCVGMCFAKGTKVLMYDDTPNVEELNVRTQSKIPIVNCSPDIRLFWYEYDARNIMIIKRMIFLLRFSEKIIIKRVAMREMRRLTTPDFIWEIPIKDFFAASDEVILCKEEIFEVNPTNSQISAASWHHLCQ
ncbi:hypothetical protein C1646_759000 [Rhizophagus diaphanus]|nr:hypothetical protein C1646_759000 [Rhizophagus diaphanus] [Rhizophagus sp. MUCL 43196]